MQERQNQKVPGLKDIKSVIHYTTCCRLLMKENICILNAFLHWMAGHISTASPLQREGLRRTTWCVSIGNSLNLQNKSRSIWLQDQPAKSTFPAKQSPSQTLAFQFPTFPVTTTFITHVSLWNSDFTGSYWKAWVHHKQKGKRVSSLTKGYDSSLLPIQQ